MPHQHHGHFTLTLSERELLPLVASGEHNAAIAAALGITDEALKKRLQRFLPVRRLILDLPVPGMKECDR